MPPNAQKGGQASGGIYAQLARNPAMLQQVLNFVSRQIGVPYAWGGTQRSTGFDCSGIIYRAYLRAGYRGIGRTTYDQVKQGVGVARQDLQPGDIVFPEPGHEGIFIGNGMILEAPHTGTNVSLIPLKQFGFWQARRLIRGGGGVVPPPALGGVSRSGLPIPHASVNGGPSPAELQQMMHQQSQLFARQQTAFTNQLASQAAQTRQQGLVAGIQAQAAQRVQGAQQAQQGLTGGLTANASVPAQGLYQQRSDLLNQIHTQALAKAGI
jgi:hypothetical protein